MFKKRKVSDDRTEYLKREINRLNNIIKNKNNEMEKLIQKNEEMQHQLNAYYKDYKECQLKDEIRHLWSQIYELVDKLVRKDIEETDKFIKEALESEEQK